MFVKFNETGRNGNIEAYRCLLMLLIVQYHYAELLYPTSNAFWNILFTAFIFWHVDGFVAISGWFGIRFTWIKFLKLWGMITFYWLIDLLYKILSSGQLVPNDFYYTGSWFGATYLGLMLCAPFVNAAIENLVSKSSRIAWSAWSLLALTVTLNWAPFHLFTCVSPSGMGSHTFATVLFVYITARLVQLTRLSDRVKKRHIFLAIAFLLASIAFWGLCKTAFQYLRGNSFNWRFFLWQTSYDAPHIWLMSLAMLVLFAWYIKLSEGVSRICLIVAPSTFPIFLMHTSGWMKNMFSLPFAAWLESNGVYPAVVTFVSAISVFMIAFCIDVIRRGGVMLLKMGTLRKGSCVD